jgi:NADH-quinone oxidoreductase subunit M
LGVVHNHILSAILLTPLAGVAVLLAIGPERVALIRRVAAGAAGLAFLAAVPLWFGYDPHGKTWQFAERGDWIPAIGASYYVGADGFSILLILLTTLIVWLAIVASWREVRERVKAFHVCILLLHASLLGAFMALDFLLFFVCWEGILASSFFLIRNWRPAKSSAAFMLAASAALLAGILRLYVHYQAAAGPYSFDITQYHVATLPFDVQRWVFIAWIAAFGVMLPLVPHLVRGAPAGIPAILVAAIVVKLGAYGIVRFILPIVPDASRALAPAFLLTPRGVSGVMIVAAAAGALAAVALLRIRFQAILGEMRAPARTAVAVAPAVLLIGFIVWAAVWPAAVLQIVETSVGRAVARANPVYAPVVAQGSDCPTAAPPDPAGPPPVFVLAEPCADGSEPAKKPEPDAGKR